MEALVLRGLVGGFVGAGLDSRVDLRQISPECCEPRGTFRGSILAELRGVPASVCRSMRRKTGCVTQRVTRAVHRGRGTKHFYMLTLPKNGSPDRMCRRLVHVRGRRNLDFHGIVMFGVCRCCPLSSSTVGDGFGTLGRVLLSRVSVSGRGVFAPSKAVTGSAVFRCYQLCRRHVRDFKKVSVTLLNVNHMNGVTFGRPNSQLGSAAHLVLLSGTSHGRTSGVFKALSGAPVDSVAVKMSAVLNTGGICLLT